MRKSKYYSNDQKQNNRVNEQIRIPTVMLVGVDGSKLGVMSNREALEKAKSNGLDLVEVAANVRPPVCRIMDYGKFRYEQGVKDKKQKQNSKNNSKTCQMKEIRLRPTIGDEDVNTKIKSLRKFIEAGHQVQLKLQYKARENAHKDLGFEVVNKIIETVSDVTQISRPPKLDGKFLTCVLEQTKKSK